MPADRDRRAKELRTEIRELTGRLETLRQELTNLHHEANPGPTIDRHSSHREKIALYRSLFAGREDAYAVRWVSSTTG